MKELRIEIPEFITHIPKSKNKYIKINGQRIYSGMNHHLRALLVRKIHTYLSPFVKAYFKKKSLNLLSRTNLKVKLEFHAPINYGQVQMRKDKNGIYRTVWKAPKIDYKPTWDCDNQWIWGKCFDDVLTEEGIIVDDSIDVIRSSGEVEFHQVETFEDRKLVFVITQI